jgi:hypothetical protein
VLFVVRPKLKVVLETDGRSVAAKALPRSDPPVPVLVPGSSPTGIRYVRSTTSTARVIVIHREAAEARLLEQVPAANSA